MDESSDAYGRLLLDHLEGRPAVEIVERDDGFIQANRGPLGYFEPVRRWPGHERRALRLARGRIVDVGAGAGRVALELAARGHDVVAIDVSPLAVEVCRRRGVQQAHVLPLEQLDGRFGVFNTVVMYGANLGLLAARERGRRALRRLARLTSDRGRILGSTLDPYETDDAEHLRYHVRNRARGRMGGQVRLRIRHRGHATPWFDYLFVSRDEVRDLVEGTGWHLARTVDGAGHEYVAVLEKERR